MDEKMHIFYLISGFMSLVFAVLGIALPLLPTTPFLLLSAFCFARSSDRLHDWLVEHKHLGPPIKDWRENGAISRKAKISAVIAIAATFGLSVLIDVSTTILMAQAITLSAVLTFILTCPDGARSPKAPLEKPQSLLRRLRRQR